MRPATTVAALLVDVAFGELPEDLHPTVWMGRAIAVFEAPALKLKNPIARRAAGLLIAGGLPALSYGLSYLALRLVPRWLRVPMEVGLLSTTISLRGLTDAARHVESELQTGDLTSARSSIRHFVGRDTDNLSETDVARAAIESVAENLSDGVAAPMFYGTLFGAPGALAYKAVNTLDSMVGYRWQPYTEFGHASARLDDLANVLPARLTALAVAATSGQPTAAMTTARRFAPLTASPNAGWPEAAFAGALDLQLGGTNAYGGRTHKGPILGTGKSPSANDIGRAVELMRWASALLVGLALALAGLRRV